MLVSVFSHYNRCLRYQLLLETTNLNSATGSDSIESR